MSDSNTSNSINGNVNNVSGNASGKASDKSQYKKFTKVSGWSGVITLGKEPTFDEVYGSGFEPMIVAHDKAVRRIPSPMLISFGSAMFGPSSDEKPAANRHQASRPIEQDGKAIVPVGFEDATFTIPPDKITLKSAMFGASDGKSASTTPDAHANDDNMSSLIDSVTDFPSLVPVAHKIAVDKGWWQDGVEKRPIHEIIANYHAEVSEAWEEYRAGRMATWYADNPNGPLKPEGFWVEIADLLIRMADAVGAGRSIIGNYMEELHVFTAGITAAEFVSLLHVEICKGLGGVYLCEKFAAHNGVDIYAVVREKLRYNVTRPHRHGGKLA